MSWCRSMQRALLISSLPLVAHCSFSDWFLWAMQSQIELNPMCYSERSCWFETWLHKTHFVFGKVCHIRSLGIDSNLDFNACSWGNLKWFHLSSVINSPNQCSLSWDNTLWWHWNKKKTSLFVQELIFTRCY